MKINWNEPRFDQDDLKEVSEVIQNSYVNEGSKTKEFEEKLKEYLGIKHVICTVNATAALFLAIKADALIKGVTDFEVIVPDMTMIATATAVEWAGGKAIPVEVLKDRMTIDLNKIKEKITNKTTAIIPVHILGRAVDMNALKDIAKESNLTIIEDAAGVLGSKYLGKYLGTLGKVGCFSLQSNKIVTCGQGGIIVTNNDEYYDTIRRLRDFGRLNNKEFLHKEIGYNLKFNDLSAALALSQFKKIEQKQQTLLFQLNKYKELLAEVNQIKFPEIKISEGEIPLWVDVFVENREELIKHLEARDIHPRPCWPSIHKNPPYASSGSDQDFPNSSFISENVLWLPNGFAITENDIIFICEEIKEFYNKPKKEMELKKIHTDVRGSINLMQDLLEDNKEFTFMEINKGFSRGGCYHSNKENFVVIKGKVRYVYGPINGPYNDKILCAGESGLIEPKLAHAFIALEDSIVSEWGITTSEKEADVKDSVLRKVVDEYNSGERTVN